MPKPKNKELYNKIKTIADHVYKHNSAYKSGFIQRMYKKYGGEYENDDVEPSLKRWFSERWSDISDIKGKHYPVYRPTIRINNKTPLTINEIDKDNLEKQIELKQKIRGSHNLPKFKKA
jgi:hypothetical protein